MTQDTRVEPGGFWRRQFAETRTRRQVAFDVIFGIVLPVICLAFDPIVFRRGFPFGSGLHPFATAAYAFIGFEMAVLAAWLFLQPRLGRSAAYFAGPLLAGFLPSLTLGILISPLSVIGIFYLGIGLLGFTPFLTAFVFWRNGVRSLVQSKPGFAPACSTGLVLVGMLITAAPPLAAHHLASRAIQRVLSRPSSADAVNHARRLGCVLPLPTDALALEYGREQDVHRKAHLARAYREIADRDVEERLAVLSD